MADTDQNETPLKPKKKRWAITLALAAASLSLPVIALGVGVGIIPQGSSSFAPIKVSTALAANVECVLKFPADASPDDKKIGAIFDQYIKTIKPNSLMVTEFSSNTSLGLGEAISKSGRGVGINPTIIVAMARKESQFATSKDKNGEYVTAVKLHNPFGRKKNTTDYLEFASFKDAIAEQGPYLKRVYVDAGITTLLDMMNKYAPSSDGNDPIGYTNEIAQWSAEMVQLGQTNYQNALGTGVCPLPNTQKVGV